MQMGLTLITGPTQTAISLDDAKAFLAIDGSDTANDPLIAALISAATRFCETYTNRCLMTQTWEMWLDQIPPPKKGSLPAWWDGTKEGSITSLFGNNQVIEIPKTPLASVVSLNTYGTDDLATAFDTSLLVLDTAAAPGRVMLKFGQIWPVNLRPRQSVQLRFTAGYAGASAIPADLIHALKLMLSHLFDDRSIMSEGKAIEMPLSVRALLDPYRVRSL